MSSRQKYILFVLVLSMITEVFAEEEEYNHSSDLLMMPTANTIQKNITKITDYELFFSEGTYGVTNSTEIGLLIPFPIAMEWLRAFTIYGKHNHPLKSKLYLE